MFNWCFIWRYIDQLFGLWGFGGVLWMFEQILNYSASWAFILTSSSCQIIAHSDVFAKCYSSCFLITFPIMFGLLVIFFSISSFNV